MTLKTSVNIVLEREIIILTQGESVQILTTPELIGREPISAMTLDTLNQEPWKDTILINQNASSRIPAFYHIKRVL